MGNGSASGAGVAAAGSGTSMETCCPCFTDRFARAPWPSTRTCPSLINRWICDRESAGSSETRKRSSRSPSLSAPTLKIRWCVLIASKVRTSKFDRSRGFSSLLFRGRHDRAREVDQHADGERGQDERDELRRGEHAHRPAFVAAVELDDEPGDGVEQDVGPERAAGKRPALPLGGDERDQDEELGSSFVQLSRMEVYAERRADVGRRKGIGERDRPGNRGRLAVTAAREEAAEAADDVAERDAGREHVARGPERQPAAADVPERHSDG